MAEKVAFALGVGRIVHYQAQPQIEDSNRPEVAAYAALVVRVVDREAGRATLTVFDPYGEKFTIADCKRGSPGTVGTWFPVEIA